MIINELGTQTHRKRERDMYTHTYTRENIYSPDEKEREKKEKT